MARLCPHRGADLSDPRPAAAVAPPRQRGAAACGRDALGPCILAAIAVAVLLPEARAALAADSWRPFALGSAAAAAVMLWRRDAGLATLAGVAAYWLAI